MGKVKQIGTGLDQNLNGTNFNHTTSETIFSFGGFTVTSNFEGRVPRDYSNTLSSFVRPVTLEKMGLTQTQSEIIHQYNTNAVLNLDKSDLNTFVRFGSAYEFLRVSIQNIITTYPASLFMNSQIKRTGVITITGFTYNPITNISTFRIPTGCTVNTFGLALNYGNVSKPDNNEVKNLNLSYDKYVVWSSINSTGNSYTVIGFTGYTGNVPEAVNYKHLVVKTIGNPFPTITGQTGSIDFHIKPNNVVFEEFRSLLNDYERNIVSQRVTGNTSGFKFTLKDPTLLDNGSITYSNTSMLWVTSDNYNIDINTPKYSNFLNIILAIGSKYDAIKTDLIARFLTPDSIKKYDLTEDGKMTKLLRLYGREFDQLKQFIDSLVNINRVSYDKVNNVPDQLIKNMSRTFGWNYFSLVNESELINSFLSLDNTERNLDTDLMPAEIDIELWRRIIMNTSYFWKSKGTREAIKSMFLLIGIPEPFVNITEYVYTVDGKIDPNTVPFKLSDFPTNSLPYDKDGYPKAPLENSDFYFQVSGDTDAGQAYLDVFRKAGFKLKQNVDNKKSWIEAGSTTRVHYSTPQYHQEDSRLIINTKEVDIALDTARGIEYDVFDYIKTKDFPANSSGFTLPFSYVNISLGVSEIQNTFTLPEQYNKTEGNLEIRYNGILLNAPRTGLTATLYQADYSVSGTTFTLLTASAYSNSYRRDVIQATFIYSGGSHPVTGITVEYIVTRVDAKTSDGGTVIPLPSFPRGDVQVTVNGIALTKGTPQFNADYILDPANSVSGSSNIIIQNPEVISYLAVNPMIQIAYVQVAGSNELNARSEVVRVDSFNSSKIYFNSSANKYVYKMNYKATQASDIKVLIDGIALEPNRDYTINVQNQYEIFLPKGIRYGTVISVYYLVAGNSYFNPIVGNDFGVGDISNLSFLEFLELIQRRLINARNRKTISDFKGGWYPSLLRVYIEYLKRGLLPADDPLHSNGYTFENLYSFLSKYNSFFQKFVDELLSATIILKKSGLLVRNTVFTKQKFTYKRGVNLLADGSITTDKRGLPMLFYFGDDGSQFLINQNIITPTTTIPTVTTNVITNILETTATGGGNVINGGGLSIITRGICWSTSPSPTIAGTHSINGSGGTGTFTSSISGLIPNIIYYVRAYATNSLGTAYGNEISFTTAAIVINPSVRTNITNATVAGPNWFITGGNAIANNVFGLVESYGMQYSSATSNWLYFPVGLKTGPLMGSEYSIRISGLTEGTRYNYRAYIVVAGMPYYGNTQIMTTTSTPKYLPTVETSTILDITQTTATGNGKVTSDGNAFVDARGIAWGLTSNPTIAGSHNGNSSGTGTFSNLLTGLIPNTPYIARAYATNSVGTAYGNRYAFTTSSPMLPPSILLTSNVGTVGGTRVEMFTIGESIVAGDIFTLGVYSHTISVTAVSGDNPLSIENKLRDAVNATTAIQWNDHGSAPASGTVGFKPTASVMAATLRIVLNYGNNLSANASR